MRRVALVVVLVLVGGLWPAVHVLASGATAVQATAAGSLQADFNNDGAEDLAVGVPGEVRGLGELVASAAATWDGMTEPVRSPF